MNSTNPQCSRCGGWINQTPTPYNYGVKHCSCKSTSNFAFAMGGAAATIEADRVLRKLKEINEGLTRLENLLKGLY